MRSEFSQAKKSLLTVFTVGVAFCIAPPAAAWWWTGGELVPILAAWLGGVGILRTTMAVSPRFRAWARYHERKSELLLRRSPGSTPPAP